MLSRRSLFSLFAGTAAIAAGARVVAAPVPKEVITGLDLAAGPDSTGIFLSTGDDFTFILDPSHSHGWYFPPSPHTHTYQPVNTRSDGSIRHRQHHPVDFPPKR